MLTLVHFIIPVFLITFQLNDRFFSIVNFEYILPATFYILLSFFSFRFGVFFAVKNINKPHDIIRKNVWITSKTLLICLLLTLVGWAVRFYIIENNSYYQINRTTQGSLEGPFYAFFFMAEIFPIYVLAIISIKFWSSSKRYFFYILCGLIAIEFIYWIPTGRKEPVFQVILVPLIIRYLKTKKLPTFKLTLILLFLASVFFSFSYYYREIAQDTSFTNFSTLGSEALEKKEDSKYNVEKLSDFTILFQRLSLVESVTACLRLIDKGIWETRDGLDYYYGFTSIIPRFFWPSKPSYHYGNDFGYASEILNDQNDVYTSISVTYYGESYLNFKWFGVIPLFLIGFFSGLIYKKIFCLSGDSWILIYIIVLLPLIYIGGSFAIYFGGIFKILPVFYFLSRFMENKAIVRQLKGGKI
jgi:hypothetical protein